MSGVLTVVGSTLNSALADLLTNNDSIEPGAEASYQLCKNIYLHHPLGAKLAEKPIQLAQSQKRVIAIPDSPEDRVKEAFERKWKEVNADLHIFNTAKLSRGYGIASIAMLTEGEDWSKPADFWKLSRQTLTFNVYDPLNTAGSLVLNQNPLSMNFQHITDIRVSGQAFHRSRTCVILNEAPIYISFTSSAFGFVGRSVYQRSLFPLKSFIQTMRTDDMVARKAGVIVAKMKQVSSIVDRAVAAVFRLKRDVVKEAENNNVIGISTDEEIESINLQNLEGPAKMARTNILENIAGATPMPAKLITQESLASTFSEGSEDAKEIARHVDLIRETLGVLYAYFDKIVRHLAWNEDFYKTIQKEFPDPYAKMDYKQAFYQWTNEFTATWPNLLEEPDSEKAKADKVKLEGIISLLEVLLPRLDPFNVTVVIRWACDQFNGLRQLFGASPLLLDYDKLEDYVPPEPLKVPGEPSEGRPFSAADAIELIREHTARQPRLVNAR